MSNLVVIETVQLLRADGVLLRVHRVNVPFEHILVASHHEAFGSHVPTPQICLAMTFVSNICCRFMGFDFKMTFNIRFCCWSMDLRNWSNKIWYGFLCTSIFLWFHSLKEICYGLVEVGFMIVYWKQNCCGLM